MAHGRPWHTGDRGTREAATNAKRAPRDIPAPVVTAQLPSASIAACNRRAASSATGCSSGSSATCTINCGFMASTWTVPESSGSRRTTTLHGSSSPICRLADTARCASGGLHAPRMTYGSMSTSILVFRVACMSISVSTPKPCSFSAARVRSTTSSSGARSVVARASVIALLRDSLMSGEREEELLEFLLGQLVDAGVVLLVEDALPQPGGDDLEAGPVQGTRDRGELGDHLAALAPALDHGDDPGELALRTAQPVENLGGGFCGIHGVNCHGRPLHTEDEHIIPRGVFPRPPSDSMPPPGSRAARSGVAFSGDRP
ncbi:conserved hypothetical protein [Rhodococcus ruber]|uniref:Uncharacterized protein n=1 Tax=Rhodococcus ruber TaxID=1830 RepID=A0A098BSH2_9NOCA|nr:conserved hypothetical protein [Rhodococcus ruber]